MPRIGSLFFFEIIIYGRNSTYHEDGGKIGIGLGGAWGVRNDKILRIPFVPFSFTKISSMRSSLVTGYME